MTTSVSTNNLFVLPPVYLLWLLLPLPGAGRRLGLGLSRLWGGVGLELVVLWCGDGLAWGCVGVAGSH
jgi:hypothetical protein